ncbi:hypothetical protein [Lacticaseibacillus suihuaensis]
MGDEVYSNRHRLHLTVQIVGGFTGKLLDQSLRVTQQNLLVVAINAATLNDGTVFSFPPELAYLEFHPEVSRFGAFIWQVGDTFQVTGSIVPRFEYPGHKIHTRLITEYRQTQKFIINQTQVWLNQLPRSQKRRQLVATLSRYKNNKLSFEPFQEQLTRLAQSLPAQHRALLQHNQQQQISAMRAIYQSLTRTAPEHPFIIDARNIQTQNLTTQAPAGRQKAIPLDKNRLQESDYQKTLLNRITSQTPLFQTNSASIPVDSTTFNSLTETDLPKLEAAAKSTTTVASPTITHKSTSFTPAPAPAPAKLTIALQQAQTVCVAAPNGRLTPVDVLAVRVSEFGVPEPTVAPPTRGRSRRKSAEDPDNGVYFDPHLPTFLVYDAALALLQLTPGYQGALSGTLRQVRLITPAKRQALERAHAQAIHHLRRLLARFLTTPQPNLTRLTDRLAAGRLTFAGYRKQLAGLVPRLDAQLAERLDATWAAFTQKWLALTFPAWFLDHVTAQDTIEDGAMLPQLRIDHTQLKDAAYRHHLFAQWQQNAGKRPLGHQ